MDFKEKRKHFFRGMGSIFNIYGEDVKIPKRSVYKGVSRRDTAEGIASAWRDVGDCLRWSMSQLDNEITKK